MPQPPRAAEEDAWTLAAVPVPFRRSDIHYLPPMPADRALEQQSRRCWVLPGPVDVPRNHEIESATCEVPDETGGAGFEGLLELCRWGEPMHVKAGGEFYNLKELFDHHPEHALLALSGCVVPVYFPDPPMFLGEGGPLAHSGDLRLGRDEWVSLRRELETRAAALPQLRESFEEAICADFISLSTMRLGRELNAPLAMQKAGQSDRIFDLESLETYSAGDLKTYTWDVCMVSRGGQIRPIGRLRLSEEEKSSLGDNFPGTVVFV